MSAVPVSSRVPAAARYQTRISDLLRDLGDIGPNRVVLDPAPGTATEADLLYLLEAGDCMCELVDGTLVEKPVGILESIVAVAICRIVGAFVDQQQLGVLSGPDGPYRLRLNLVRVPDIAMIPWSRIPGGDVTQVGAVCSAIPSLAVEVLSESNTQREMERKRNEYFEAGVLLVWLVDPETRTVMTYGSASDSGTRVDAQSTLSGEAVLPGFSVTVNEFFKPLDARPKPAGQGE